MAETFYNRDKMWFGTDDFMQWIDTPNTGADVSNLGFSADSVMANGGGYVRNSWDSHKTYQFSWGESASLALAHAINAYRNGSWGRGLIYFHDPMTYGTNILPKRWADPSMAANYEAEPLIPDVFPTTIPAAPGPMGLPVTSATYPLTTGYSSQTNNSELFIPIPPGMTLLLGAIYTGGGKLYVRVDGNAPVDLPTLDAASITAGSAVNLKVTGSKAYLGVRNTTGAATSISIQAITGRLADSARVPDYMGTPTTNLLANPSFETASGTVDVITNLMTNPDFEAAGAAVVLRTNLCTIPRATAGWASVAPGTGGAVNTTLVADSRFAGGSARRGDWTTAATTSGWLNMPGLISVLAGDVYTFSMRYAISGNSAAPFIAIGGGTPPAHTAVRGTIDHGDGTFTAWLVASFTAAGTAGPAILSNWGTMALGGWLLAGNATAERASSFAGYFDGDIQPILRTNIALNPNAVAAAGFRSNAVTVNTSTRNVPVPAPHPQGITTCASSVLNGPQSTPAILSQYDIDVLTNLGPARTIGAWLYVNAPGYQARIGVTGPWAPIPANTWMWLVGDPIAAGAYSGAYIQKISGDAGATDAGYITGVTALAGSAAPVDSFSGITVKPGFSYIFTGVANNSPSIERDADFSTRWQGTANASPSELTGISAPTVSPSGAGALPVIRSSRFAVQGSYSTRSVGGAVPASGSYFEFTNGMAAGSTYTNIITAYSEAAMPAATQTRQITVRCYGSATPLINGPQAGATPSTTELRHTFTVPADASGGATMRVYVTSAVAGTVIPDTWWDMGAIVAGAYSGPAFSGATTPSPDPDMVYAWTGVPNASTSVLRGTGISGIDTANPERAVRIQSGKWSADGTRSMRIIPGSGMVNSSYGAMVLSGLTVGATYTLLGRVRLTAPLTGSISPYALAFWVSSGSTPPDVAYSSSATNAPGVYEVRGTFVANAVNGQLRIMNGSANSSEEVFWDAVGLFAGSYAGPWGSGTFTTPINIEEALGPWYSGEGHSGARFVGTPTLVNYNGVSGGQMGLSCTLKEVGAWV